MYVTQEEAKEIILGFSQRDCKFTIANLFFVEFFFNISLKRFNIAV